MPKKKISESRDLTAQQVREKVAEHFQGKYEVYDTKLLGADFIVKKSGWTGLSCKFLIKDDGIWLRYAGFAPSAFARVLVMGIIPALILTATAWKEIQNEMASFLDQADFS